MNEETKKLDISEDLYNRLCRVLSPHLCLADAVRRSARAFLRNCADVSKIKKVSASRKRKQIKYVECEATKKMTPPQLRGCLLLAVEKAEKNFKPTTPPDVCPIECHRLGIDPPK